MAVVAAMAIVATAKRLTRGPLGKFAGDDFPCDEKDIFRDADWARGACMVRCRGAKCAKAVELCEKLPHCAAVNINVEGTIATLKRESALSAATSKRKTLKFTQNARGRAPGRDEACAPELVRQLGGTPYKTGPDDRTPCEVACPKLNCTAATALCFQLERCSGVDIGFNVGGQPAVARLRFAERAVAVS